MTSAMLTPCIPNPAPMRVRLTLSPFVDSCTSIDACDAFIRVHPCIHARAHSPKFACRRSDLRENDLRESFQILTLTTPRHTH